MLDGASVFGRERADVAAKLIVVLLALEDAFHRRTQQLAALFLVGAGELRVELLEVLRAVVPENRVRLGLEPHDARVEVRGHRLRESVVDVYVKQAMNKVARAI